MVNYFEWSMEYKKASTGDIVTLRLSGYNQTISVSYTHLDVYKRQDYDKYDGVCGDGQHRTIALMFDELKDVTATYQPEMCIRDRYQRKLLIKHWLKRPR